MLCANELNKNASQSGDRNVDQVAYRQPCRFEVNSNHRPDFEIDKQEQEVAKSGVPPMHHAQESIDRRPHGRSTKREQRKIVKRVDQQRSYSIGEVPQLRVKIGGELA